MDGRTFEATHRYTNNTIWIIRRTIIVGHLVNVEATGVNSSAQDAFLLDHLQEVDDRLIQLKESVAIRRDDSQPKAVTSDPTRIAPEDAIDDDDLGKY